MQEPEALNTVYNIAFGEKTTLNQLAENLQKILGADDPSIVAIPVQHGPNREGDIPHSLASIEKARKKLGYQPAYNFRDGLQIAVKWYLENHPNTQLPDPGSPY